MTELESPLYKAQGGLHLGEDLSLVWMLIHDTPLTLLCQVAVLLLGLYQLLLNYEILSFAGFDFFLKIFGILVEDLSSDSILLSLAFLLTLYSQF